MRSRTVRALVLAAAVLSPCSATVPCWSLHHRYTAVNALGELRNTCSELIKSEELNSLFCESYKLMHEWAWHLCAGKRINAHECDGECDSYIGGTAGSSGLDHWRDPMFGANTTDLSQDEGPGPVSDPGADDANLQASETDAQPIDEERPLCEERECIVERYCQRPDTSGRRLLAPSVCSDALDVHQSIEAQCAIIQDNGLGDQDPLCRLYHETITTLVACREPYPPRDKCDLLCGTPEIKVPDVAIDELRLDPGLVCEVFQAMPEGPAEPRGDAQAGASDERGESSPMSANAGGIAGVAGGALAAVAGVAVVRRRMAGRRRAAEVPRAVEVGKMTTNPLL